MELPGGGEPLVLADGTTNGSRTVTTSPSGAGAAPGRRRVDSLGEVRGRRPPATAGTASDETKLNRRNRKEVVGS